MSSIKILSVNDSLFYINAASLKKQCHKISAIKQKENNQGCCLAKSNRKEEQKENEPETQTLNMTELDANNNSKKPSIKFLIFDFSSVNFIDESSVQALEELRKEYKEEGTQILLASCNGNFLVKKSLKNYV